MRRLVYSCLSAGLALALSACSSNGDETDSAVDDGTAEVEAVEQEPPAEPPEPVWGGETTYLRSGDGTPVAAEWLSVEGAEPRGTVILIHMLGQERSDWSPLVQPLVESGFDVVGVDLRGHGQSKLNGSYADFTQEQWRAARADVRAALDYAIPDKPDPYFVCGASIGANLAFLEVAGDNRSAGVILLSPGKDYRGVRPAEGLEEYDDRPVLLVAAEDDAFSAQTVRELAADLTNARVEVYPDGGHGTRLLSSRPEVRELIIDWLVQRLAER